MTCLKCPLTGQAGYWQEMRAGALLWIRGNSAQNLRAWAEELRHRTEDPWGSKRWLQAKGRATGAPYDREEEA